MAKRDGSLSWFISASRLSFVPKRRATEYRLSPDAQYISAWLLLSNSIALIVHSILVYSLNVRFVESQGGTMLYLPQIFVLGILGPPKAIPRKKRDPRGVHDLTDIFKSDEDWDCLRIRSLMVPEQLAEYEGTLGESAARLLEYMQLDDEVSVRLEKRWLRRVQGRSGHGGPRYQTCAARASAAASQSRRASFATPELIAIPEGDARCLLPRVPGLETYRRNLYRLRRRGAYPLPRRGACSPLPGRWPTRRTLSAAH